MNRMVGSILILTTFTPFAKRELTTLYLKTIQMYKLAFCRKDSSDSYFKSKTERLCSYGQTYNLPG